MMRSVSMFMSAITIVWAAPAAAQAISLPAEIAFPEGIAHDPATHTVYTAGAADGTLLRIDLASGKQQVLRTDLAGHIGDAFPGALGMELDGRGRLWIAGGRTRKIFVLDARTGETLAAIEAKDGSTGLINDVAIVGDTAYFTDTLHPILWSVKLGGTLPASATPWLNFAGTALQYGEGANLNGVTATADGRTLIVGQMAKGLLFRIDLASKAVSPIDLKGETVAGADGLVLKGDTLFVVRQPAAEIVTIRLAPDLSSGTVVKRTQTPGLAWPATATLDGDTLIAVNSQFNTRADNTPKRPFTLLRVPLAELGAR
jgi:sugar lactone lactonase YvrE